MERNSRHPLVTILLWIIFTPFMASLVIFGLAFVLLSCGRVGGYIR
jgi:hypothetical protein